MIDSHNHRSTLPIHVIQRHESLGGQTRPFDDRLYTNTGIALSGTEMRSDLIKLFDYLNVNLAEYEEGSSPFLKTRVEALLYADRVAAYAIYDYPRSVEGEPQITTLWEALHRIRCAISTWQTGEFSGSGRTELSIIEHIIQNTLREVTPSETL